MQHIERELLGDGDEDALLRIPSALPAATILARAQDQHARQAGFAAGRKWGGIYHEEGPLTRLQADVWALFNCSNTLYPEVFPGTRKFEAEVIAMTVDMLHGRECGAVGLLTSGGTESILIAVLAYREQARARGNDEPEILAAVTAHPALTKACHYFGVSLTKLPVCPQTLRLLPDTVAAAISRRTVAVYASAPSFTHGVVDPIEELASLAAGRGIGLHVDNCLGGFLLSFMQRIGKHDAPFDFRVAGVTTISCDCHKFGHTSKGVSVVAFRDPALRRLSYVPSVDGCEGLYVTPTLQGSRAGATIAQAWATLLFLGEEGYRRMAEEVTQVADQMAEIVAKIPELQLLVQPDAAIVPITTAPGAGFSIYQVASLLEAAGWNLFTGQHPPVMSACIGEQHLRVTEEWGRDLEAAVARLKAEPGIQLEGHAAVYGSAAAVPDELLDSVLRSYVDIRMQVKPKDAQ